jgi:peroxiredoxin
MIRKIFTLLFLGCLLTAAPSFSFAQVANPTSKVEALKKLEALDPFKMNPQVGLSFDPQKGEELYFEDGKKITFAEFQSYVSRPERDYMVVPYVNPADKEKVVAMLVRKASASEIEQMKNLLEAQTADKKMYSGENGDPGNPGDMSAIKFDPALKAKDYIKGLTKLKDGSSTGINVGRVAIFDEKGNLIPIADEKDGMKNFTKYMRNLAFSHDNYIDEDEVIRAIVFRPSTMEERKAKGTGENFTEVVVKVGDDGGDTNSGRAKLDKSVKLPDNAPAMPSGGITGDNFKKKFGVGSEARDFKAVDMNGNTVDLAAFKGKKTVVLNFWFGACKPCVEEMPELNKMVAEMKGKNVEFISICTDSKDDAKDFLTKIKYNYNCIPDGRPIANQYNVTAYPTHVVINKKGEIVLLQQGFSDKLIPQIKAEINKGQK